MWAKRHLFLPHTVGLTTPVCRANSLRGEVMMCVSHYVKGGVPWAVWARRVSSVASAGAAPARPPDEE